MERRAAVRFDAKLFLEDVSKVMLIFPDRHEIEASVVDISSQGLRVSITPSCESLSIPQKDETVEIVFSTIQLQLTGKYVFSMNDQDGSILVGFYIYDSDDQSKLREILDRID